MTPKYLILDFDSTIIQVEALDELAALALAQDPNGKKAAEEIAHITNLGMEGKITIEESLSRRLPLFNAGKPDVNAILPMLKEWISPSFRSNKSFFERYQDQVFIISNGFTDYILPVAEELSIKSENVFANSFVYDHDGQIQGYEKENLLAQANGKSKQLLDLDLTGEVYVVGDGMTDFQMTETGKVTKFIAYVENVHREAVAEKADHVVESFDAFLGLGFFDQ